MRDDFFQLTTDSFIYSIYASREHSMSILCVHSKCTKCGETAGPQPHPLVTLCLRILFLFSLNLFHCAHLFIYLRKQLYTGPRGLCDKSALPQSLFPLNLESKGRADSIKQWHKYIIKLQLLQQRKKKRECNEKIRQGAWPRESKLWMLRGGDGSQNWGKWCGSAGGEGPMEMK